MFQFRSQTFILAIAAEGAVGRHLSSSLEGVRLTQVPCTCFTRDHLACDFEPKSLATPQNNTPCKILGLRDEYVMSILRLKVRTEKQQVSKLCSACNSFIEEKFYNPTKSQPKPTPNTKPSQQRVFSMMDPSLRSNRNSTLEYEISTSTLR